MAVFALRRMLWTIPVLLLCTTILFGLLKATAESPLRHERPLGLSSETKVKYGDFRPPAIARNMRRHYGLDRPWYVQYWRFVDSLAHANFGPTLTFPNRSVNEIIEQQGPITAELVGLALAWAFALGIPLSVVAAIRHGGIVDRAVGACTAGMLGLPSFFVGAILLWLFGAKVGVVPVFGWDGWRSKLLPPLVLSLVPMGLIIRVLRAELLEVLGREYIAAARGKGLRRRRVVAVHALRPAMIPVLSLSGPLLGLLVTGLFVVEWLFAIPGIGRYFIASAGVGDYPLTLGLTIVLTVAIVLVNMLADISIGFLDPRTR